MQTQSFLRGPVMSGPCLKLMRASRTVTEQESAKNSLIQILESTAILALSGQYLNLEDIKNIVSLLRERQFILIRLDLSNNLLCPQSMIALIPLFESLTILEVNLSGCGLVGRPAGDLLRRLYPKGLSNLNLANNKLGNQKETITALRQLLEAIPFLQKLNLSENGITSKRMAVLAPSLAASFFLKELALSKNKIGDHGLTLLALNWLVHRNQALRTLKLDSNYIETSGIETLCAYLGSNMKLKNLDLHSNTLSAAGLARLCTTLSYHPLKKLNLNNIGLKNKVSMVVQGLLKNTHLQYLSLKHNYLDHEEFAALADLVRVHPTLCSLNLRHNPIKSPTALLFAQAFADSFLGALEISFVDCDMETITKVGKIIENIQDRTLTMYPAQFNLDPWLPKKSIEILTKAIECQALYPVRSRIISSYFNPESTSLYLAISSPRRLTP